jgi:hypothetical protein
MMTELHVLGLLQAIEDGNITLTSEYEPQDVFAGNVLYKVHGEPFEGWSIAVFNDCGEWDYVAYIEDEKGNIIEYLSGSSSSPTREGEGLDSMENVNHYRPSADTAWRRYGIPGHLRFRNEIWPGFTGIRSADMIARLHTKSKKTS